MGMVQGPCEDPIPSGAPILAVECSCGAQHAETAAKRWSRFERICCGCKNELTVYLPQMVDGNRCAFLIVSDDALSLG